MKIIISALIFIFICIPAIIISVPVVAILLHTKWDGRSTIFGNAKWGRANNHPSPDSITKGYWQEFLWLVYRNPVNNLMAITLAANQTMPVIIRGNAAIGDKVRGGFYYAKMRNFWEYYWVRPYGNRCIRVRIGWKIQGNDTALASYVFAINPWKKYTGVK